MAQLRRALELNFADEALPVRASRDRTRPPSKFDREFILWDGEGAKDKDRHNRQSYVLFGNSSNQFITSPELKTAELLRFIIDQGKLNPHAYHCGFAFDYDVNMILRNLAPSQFRSLRKNGNVKVGNFRIEHIPSKWFQVTEYGPSYASNRRDRTTVRIADIFGFFQCSFLKAIKSYIPDSRYMDRLDIIERGKAARNSFTYDQIGMITEYWSVEIQLMRELAEKLRELLYDVNLEIGQWHGPGVIANFGYRNNGIRNHKQECDPDVYDAARYAYAGGRFERFHIGRYREGYGFDINSAYPYAISQLPSLTEGTWIHRELPDKNSIVEFGLYRVKLTGSPVAVKPSPLFHRDHAGNIAYPWYTEGWYWSPEVALLKDLTNVEILECWEYVGWETRPFAFVHDVYEQRRQLKKANIASQMALKLFLSSLYGKMAQRVGWERTGNAPSWHQLEWAGWVTSATRAKLYAVMARIPFDQLIAVETDGIYTTCKPSDLGIEDSSALGGWEVTPFDEIRYVQSGMYAIGAEGKWKTKYRGLDSGSLNAWKLRKHLQLLAPNVEEWPLLSGPTTRFVGYRQALWREDMNMGPMKTHLCKWETAPKELSAGVAGKRVHSAKLCAACHAGANAWEMPHETVIRSRSIMEPMSSRHDIPWLDKEKPAWRDYMEGMVA